MRGCLQRLVRKWLSAIYRTLFFCWVGYVYESMSEQIEFEGYWDKRCVYGRVVLRDSILVEFVLKIKNTCSEGGFSSKGTEVSYIRDSPAFEDVPEILDVALDTMVQILLGGERISFEHRVSERVLT